MQQTNQPSAQGSSSDDGSSPLVPILIAVAILAAISAALVMRNKRQGKPGGSVSPKVG